MATVQGSQEAILRQLFSPQWGFCRAHRFEIFILHCWAQTTELTVDLPSDDSMLASSEFADLFFLIGRVCWS